jgi:hypothetical protein
VFAINSSDRVPKTHLHAIGLLACASQTVSSRVK